MAVSYTANLNLTKPEVGASSNVWGGIPGLNGDMDLIDGVFAPDGLSTVAPAAGAFSGVPGVGLRVGVGMKINIEGTLDTRSFNLKGGVAWDKIATLDVSLLTTATTRTYKFPDASGTLFLLEQARSYVPVGTVFSGYYGNTPPAGFVFVDGRTIGSATSAATNRANADTEALFKHLWANTANTQCPVLPSRGASAAADWTANKRLTLPNHSGRVMAGRDDLSGTAAGIVTGFTARAQLQGLQTSSTGTITSSGTNAFNFGNISFNFTSATAKVNANSVSGLQFGGSGVATQLNDAVSISDVDGYTTVSASFGVSVSGASGNFNIVQPSIAVDVIMAL